MQTAISEDDIYRASTQYRLWSFTPESLSSLRTTTNTQASEQVIAAIKRSQSESNVNSNSNSNASSPKNDTSTSTPPPAAVDTLTVAEEQLLIAYYTETLLRSSDTFKFPTIVKATAAQYLKRFYLSNSPMTYHPRHIFPTCLFLATKTENHHIPLSTFAAKFPKTTSDDVIAPEFILTQALRFAFDVRHPHRGMRGGLMELLAMARGDAALVPGPRTASTVQAEMMELPPAPGTAGKPTTTAKDLEKRCEAGAGRAQETLATAALLTDVYLLFTPAQIWLAALMLADEPLATFYLATKFPNATRAKPQGGAMGDAVEEEEQEQSDEAALRQRHKDHILRTICDCADMLSAYKPASAAGKEELVRIDKKLYRCQNPEKKDLVKLNAAQKRGESDESEEEERAAKKRRLEREAAKQDDVFGGPLLGGKGDG